MTYNDDGPRLEAEGQTPNQNHSTPHDVEMRLLAARIAWLKHHRHWWIRSIREGRWSA